MQPRFGSQSRSVAQNNTKLTFSEIQEMYQNALLGTQSLFQASKEEKIALKETEDEFKRKGFFKRIFPSVDF